MNAEKQKDHKNIDLISLPKKSFWKLSIPITIFLLFEAFYSIGDMIWLCELSEDALFAVGTSAPLILFISAFGDSIGQGTNSIMTRFIGSNDYESSYNSLMHGIILGLAIWILFAWFIHLLDTTLAMMMIKEDLDYILAYLNPMFLFSGFFIFSNIFCETLQAEGNAKTPVIIMVLSNIVNLALDPILIFTFNMGVSGAAYASLFSSALCMLTFLYLYIKGKTKIPLSLKYFKFRTHILYEIFKVAIPNLIEDSSTCFTAIFFNAYLFGTIGDIGIILYAVSIKIRDFLRSPIKGMGRGLMSVTGHLFGAKEIHKLNEMYMYVLKVSLYASIIIAVAFFLLREPVFEAFEIVNMPTSIFYIALYGIIIIAAYPFINISSKMLNGFGKSYYSLFFSILKYTTQIALIIILSESFKQSYSVLVGITLGEIIFAAVYFICIKLLVKRFEKNKDSLTVT